MDFIKFKTAVAAQFARMQTSPLYRTRVHKDDLWATYLRSFPPGSNPVFRTRTEYDCSCCRHYIKAVGNVVAIENGKLVSIWNVSIDEPAFQAVADAMAALVTSAPIADAFLHYERTAGTDKSFEQATSGALTWSHFFSHLPANVVMKKDLIPSALSTLRSTHDVFLRSLQELSADAIETALDLIAQNSLYRGEEHKAVLERFRALKHTFEGTGERDRDFSVWTWLRTEPHAVSHIRNTAIGTLLVDLSEGMELEAAVRRFEAVVAPANYKRPTALVTPRMVEQAKATIEELGLTSALSRRHATTRDITANNVLFADRNAKQVMGDVFDTVAAEAKGRGTKKIDRVEEVSIDKFVAEILPRVDSIEAYFENRHAGNLVSVVAPVDPTAGALFKWPNNFSWSYAGEVADSIKERVKAAGGNVTGDLCCRLAWWNFDDLDLHMHEPGGEHIFYASKGPSRARGSLDVDMNAGRGDTREPVENIFYPEHKRMPHGTYRLEVNNFRRRESTNVGFEVDIDALGTVHRFVYEKGLRDGQTVPVADILVSASGIEVKGLLPSTQASRQRWGLATQAFHRVSLAMLSPNHWDGEGVGNRHFFFILDGCRAEETPRGFFNEFLKNELNAHRKVFEVVAGKMRVPDSTEQLSGLGFSSTQRAELLCRVRGSFTRTLKVLF